MRKYPPAIQLYSVRNSMKADAPGTLRALAEMGWQAVEFAFEYGGLEPAALAGLLRDLGLRVCGFHARPAELADAQHRVYDYARALQTPFVTSSLPAKTRGDWPACVAVVSQAAAVAAANGFRYTYHNHVEEFDRVGDEYALDYIYRQTDPALVGAQLDVHYITRGGLVAADYIVKYAGRVRQVHLKDVGPGDDIHTEVGNGKLDLTGIAAAAANAGAEWLICEQEFCKGLDLDSARITIGNLRRLGLA